MTVPTGGALAIYAAINKSERARIRVSLDLPQLYEDHTDAFATIDPTKYAFSDDGPPPLDSGVVLIQQIGGPIRRWFETRPIIFPGGATDPVDIEFDAGFPINDPVFSQVITVGGILNDQDNEPFRIIQHGSMRVGGGQIAADDIGRLWYTAASNHPGPEPNDSADKHYHVSWADGDLFVESEDGTIYGPAAGPRPFYIKFGEEMPPEDWAIATLGRAAAEFSPEDAATYILNGGSAAAPVPMTTIRVSNLVIKNPDGYAAAVFPAWVTEADEEGPYTWEDAPDGVRFEEAGKSWAYIPKRAIKSWRCDTGLATEKISDTLDVILSTPAPVATDPPWFVLDRLIDRNIILDTQIGTEGGEDTAPVQRKMVGVITDTRIVGDTISLTTRDRLTDALDMYGRAAFVNLDGVPGATGKYPDGYKAGLVISGPDDDGPTSVITTIIRLADALRGSPLGAAMYEAHLLDHKPVSLDTGGQVLLPTVQEIVDRCGLEWWRRFRTSGDAIYGQHMIAARTLAPAGDPYNFVGQTPDGGTVSNIDWPPGVMIDRSRRNGVGQLTMRNNSPSMREIQRNIDHLPILGTYPSAAYPPNDREWSDSYAALSGFGLTTLITIHDYTGTNVTGGVAYRRWRAENLERQRFEIHTTGHDWMEPTDGIGLIDLRTGLDGEAAIIQNVSLSWDAEDGHIRGIIQGVLTDHVEAIRRTT